MKKNATCFLFLLLIFFRRDSLAQSTAHNFTYGGATRTYRVYRPTNFNTSEHLPLVINMHGLGSNGQQQELYTLFNNVADTARCVVTYPDGLSNQWNALIGQSGTDDVGFLSALIDTLHSNYNIDLSRVYATGMSNGGYMSFRLACELSCRIAAIASVTGLLQETLTQCSPLRKVPVIQIHGTADSTVPYTNTFPYASVASTISRWKSIDACPSSPAITAIPNINTTDGCTAEKQYYGLCGDSTLLIHYKITGGGHTWPGSNPLASIGVTNRDFSANSEIWNFFKHYTNSCVTTGINESDSQGEVKVYPNPVSNSLIVELATADKDFSIPVIYDATGKVQTLNFSKLANQIVFNTSMLDGGIYFVQFRMNGNCVTRKFVKTE